MIGAESHIDKVRLGYVRITQFVHHWTELYHGPYAAAHMAMLFIALDANSED